MDSQRLENKITELTSLVRQLAIGQHHTSPPAKEIKPENAEVVGLIGGHQYGGQPYGSWQYDGQQNGRKQYRPTQGKYSTKRFSSAQSMP
ncbi:hypothetical protein CR513_36575, partial [Mucuna pruriens]